MEAALLKPALMTEVDCNSNTLNAELEVKKLQELVRKLEQQNEQLRTRASCSSKPHVLLYQQSTGSLSPPLEPFDYYHPNCTGDEGTGAEENEDTTEPSILDDLELLDLDSLSCSESEETWLYTTSKSREPADDSLTPLQWCRQTLDSPKSEVEAARKSLSIRLEQVSRWRSSLSSPSPSPTPTHTPPSSSPVPPPSGRIAGVSPITSSPSTKTCSTPQPSERHVPSFSSPLHPGLHRSLSPIGKELSPVAERTPTFLPHRVSRSRSLRCSPLSPQSSADGDLGASETDDDCINLGYKLQDLTDVQVMARLQEESLRQDYASTSSILASRRSQSYSFQLSSAGLGPEEEDEEEEDDEDYAFLPPPQPRLTRLPHSHTFTSTRDWRRSTSPSRAPPSTPCNPSYPSAGFAFQAPAQGPGPGPGIRTGSDKLRRSMPNLVRAPSMPSVPILTNPSASPSLLRNSLSFDSSSCLSRLQSSIPPPVQLQSRVQSVGNFSSLSRQPPKATAYVSPTIKGSASFQPLFSTAPSGLPPTLRSSLPRPASFIATSGSAPRGKAAQSSRSLLTPPKSLSTFSAHRDGTWRDGCY